jgi:dCTP deaminase
MISPKTFSIIPSENEPISQLRFFKGSDRLSRKDLEREVGHECFIRFPAEQPSLFDIEERVPVVGDDISSHLLTVDLNCDIVAYKTKNTVEPIYLGSRSMDPKEYFDYIHCDEVKVKGLILEKGVGYLLGSYERIMLPAHLAGEVVPYSEKYGELRNHFAGYIDSGFGLNTPNGNSITFEVITNETGVCIRHSQSIGEIRYEYMSSKPNVLYQGNYKLQPSGPQLPKYFRK